MVQGAVMVQGPWIDCIYYYAQAAPTLNPAGSSCWHYPSETGTVSYCGQIDITNLVTQCDIPSRYRLSNLILA
jgi:hypothetical protein